MEARTLANLILETCAKRISGEPVEVVITIYDEEKREKMIGRDIRWVLANPGGRELDIMCIAERNPEGEPR